MSPAGEALAMLPPSVPRFWIWAAPIVAGRLDQRRQVLAAQRRPADVGVGRQGPEGQALALGGDPAQLVEAPQVHGTRPEARPSSPVSATSRSVPPATGRAGPVVCGHRRVRLGEGRAGW